MAVTKFLALILVLQVVTSSLGDLVVDINTDLETAGFATSDTYYPKADAIPASVPIPDGIKDSENPGIWHFSRDSNGFGGLLVLQQEISFSKIEVTYYAPEKLTVYYQDVANEGEEVMVPFPKISTEAWTTLTLDAARDEASTKSVSFNFTPQKSIAFIEK